MKNAAPSRRSDKSLALLAKRFLKLCMSMDDSAVCLNETAKLLKVERRRIYDIVNILEVLGVVSRKGKNLYNWLGIENINKVVLRLKEEANDEWAKSIGSLNHNAENVSSSEYQSVNEVDEKKSRKENSLGFLSEKFIHLFFTNDNKDNCISLEYAALHLMQKYQTSKSSGKSPLGKICMSSGAFKSRVRRLYDIANVLMALGLIEKMFLASSRKPAFRWVSSLQPANTNAASAKYSKKNAGELPQKRHRPESIDPVDEKPRKCFAKSTKASEAVLSRSNSLTFSFSQPLPQINARLKGPHSSLSNSAFRAFEAAQSTPLQSSSQPRSQIHLAKILAMKRPIENPFIARYRRALSSWSGYAADIKSFMESHNRILPVSSTAGTL